ncbi:hypothetical protein [Aeromicrobium wangtongii]|uniref:hypothetical protein n=1 Tax=Aeromicrobium wangtongii TaxID=2969247 RepID=UPI002018364C|nr:hypothetical protein [Aeromicrobium wangtongii]MCL3819091.1 hypothetical protein [Aeromicrobium wangtongii]
MSELINDGFPFTVAQGRNLGFSSAELRRMHASMQLRREFRGVYVDARVPDSRRGRLRAINLVTPDNAVVCDETAAWVRGLDVFSPGTRFDFTPAMLVRHGGAHIVHPGSRGRQAILATEDVEFVDGVHVTTAVRTVSDLLRRMYRPYALAAADAFAAAELVTAPEVIEYVAKLKGYRGIVQARSLAAMIEPRTQSPGESWQRLRILDAGFPPPEPQHEVVDDFGRSYFIDLPYPDRLIGSEYDGHEFHTDDAHRRHDAERREYLSELYGWRWVIGTRQRIFGQDTSFEDELGALLGMKPIHRWWGTRAQPTLRAA